MATPRQTNPLALAVLVLLYERPMHPYEMSTTLRERRKEDSIKLNYGSLYSVVASLQKSGLIEARETLREGNRPERTIYAITEPGKARMTDWLSELVSVPKKEFTNFEAALSLMGALDPQEVLRLLELRLRALEMQRTAGEAVKASAPPNFPRIFMIEYDFTSALLDAEIAFVRSLVTDLRTKEFGGFRLWQRMSELRAGDLSSEDASAILREEFPDELSWTEDGRTS
ncbi:PadR family transcriptional regulator [Actinopolymorpha rutila]|uniref:DNA-binding PadR family transcriptional regulator n=1 Tax=Actinopolymorpha rutila TaxID=446787 RepID=A0A852ZC78_9ACTN|nr:PadR family transcriptional regulator [Actinopolymorpha rutila]NYH90524.1 DNA-binding PadR family transcriptional regulator [Actinopolymorpha rutila]